MHALLSVLPSASHSLDDIHQCGEETQYLILPTRQVQNEQRALDLQLSTAQQSGWCQAAGAAVGKWQRGKQTNMAYNCNRASCSDAQPALFT